MNGMAWPLFYRQSGMFVSWLRTQDADAFNHVLRELREGGNLFHAPERRYGRSIPALHRQWKNAAQREKSVELGASMKKIIPSEESSPQISSASACYGSRTQLTTDPGSRFLSDDSCVSHVPTLPPHQSTRAERPAASFRPDSPSRVSA